MTQQRVSPITVTSLLPATVLFRGQAALGQSADLLQLNNSSGTTLSKFDSAGLLTVPNLTVTSTTVPANGVYLPAANTLGFATNSTRAVTIDSTGNVGIGTTSPTAKLDVNGSINANNILLANPVINGAFDIWQRGTSIAGSTTAYTADRWNGYRAVAGSTFSRQTTGDTTNLPNIQYCARVQRDSGNTATNSIYFGQSMETVNSIPFAGKTVTISFYARKGANFSDAGSAINCSVITGTGTDQNNTTGAYTGSATPISQGATLTTTWQRFSYSGTIASTATEITTQFYFTPVGTAGAADYFEVTGVQLDLGNVALPFRRTGGTIQGELAACQRYYYRQSGQYNYIGAAYWNTTSRVFLMTNFPTQMRTAPTLSYSSGTGFYIEGSGAGTCTSVAANQNSVFNAYTTFNKTAAGATLYAGAGVYINDVNGWIDWSAEL